MITFYMASTIVHKSSYINYFIVLSFDDNLQKDKDREGINLESAKRLKSTFALIHLVLALIISVIPVLDLRFTKQVSRIIGFVLSLPIVHLSLGIIDAAHYFFYNFGPHFTQRCIK